MSSGEFSQLKMIVLVMTVIGIFAGADIFQHRGFSVWSGGTP
jgi:hypothetical protein